MPSIRSFLVYWSPIILLMALIFSASTDVMSEHHTSRFIVPFLRWLNPRMSEETIHRIHAVIRKGGHVTEYALLSILVWRALRKPTRNDPRPWSWATALWSVSVAAAYAGTDELHQSFVPSRWASGWDVLLDTAGATCGLLLVWIVGRCRSAW